jgi:hypothetical protein
MTGELLLEGDSKELPMRVIVIPPRSRAAVEDAN